MADTTAHDMVAAPWPPQPVLQTGTAGDDLLRGGNDVDDSLVGLGGDDTLIGLDSNDTLVGGPGVDQFDGGPGWDWIRDEAGRNEILFGRGHDSDYVELGKTDKSVIRLKPGISPADLRVSRVDGWLSLQVLGTTDQLMVRGYYNGDRDYGKGHPSIEAIIFDDGTRWTAADIQRIQTQGTEGHDWLTADDVDTRLNGLGSFDVLRGGSGHDTLDGGTGNDALHGSLMSVERDTYIFDRGYGHDSIYGSGYSGNSPPRPEDTDIVQFGAGIRPQDLELVADASTLWIRLKNSDDTLLISSYFSTTAPGSQYSMLRFADGTVWRFNEVREHLRGPSPEDDHLFGTPGPDFIRGLGGNDEIRSAGGNDTLEGNDGNDVLDGDAGNDRLFGGAGDDALLGGAGNDRLDGGEGDDRMTEDQGNNTYVCGRGYGHDNVLTSPLPGYKQETVELLPGIAPEDVKLTCVDSSLVIQLKGTDDSLTIVAFFVSEATSGHQIERITFADGTVWGLNTIKYQVLQASTDGADTLSGYASDDRIKGLGGDDLLDGRAGKDTIEAGSGQDSVWGGRGDDVVLGGAGDDLLNGDDGNDSLRGEDGQDRIFGGQGADTLYGGAGDDTLSGGAGQDTYIFGRRADHDLIDNTAASPDVPETMQADVIQLGADIVASDVHLRQDGSTLWLDIAGSNATLQVQGYWRPGSREPSIDEIRFADGSLWDTAELLRRTVTANETAAAPTPSAQRLADIHTSAFSTAQAATAEQQLISAMAGFSTAAFESTGNPSGNPQAHGLSHPLQPAGLAWSLAADGR